MKFLLPFFLFALVSSCFAQAPEPLWTGTVTVDLSTNRTPLTGQKTKHVVYRSPKTDQGEVTDIEENSIGSLMLQAFQEGRLIGFKDQGLQERFTEKSITSLINRRDTFMIVDPTSYEITMQVAARAVDQYWAWDDDAARLVFSPIDYALLSTITDENGKVRSRYPEVNWAAPWYRSKN